MFVINFGVVERGIGILTCVFFVCRYIFWCLIYDVYDELCSILRRYFLVICFLFCNVIENYKLKKKVEFKLWKVFLVEIRKFSF